MRCFNKNYIQSKFLLFPLLKFNIAKDRQKCRCHNSLSDFVAAIIQPCWHRLENEGRDPFWSSSLMELQQLPSKTGSFTPEEPSCVHHLCDTILWSRKAESTILPAWKIFWSYFKTPKHMVDICAPKRGNLYCPCFQFTIPSTESPPRVCHLFSFPKEPAGINISC